MKNYKVFIATSSFNEKVAAVKKNNSKKFKFIKNPLKKKTHYQSNSKIC